MKHFFAPNITSTGRLIRGAGGGLLLVGGVIAGQFSPWYCVIGALFGGFMLYEAVRGWCIMRACGIKTKV